MTSAWRPIGPASGKIGQAQLPKVSVKEFLHGAQRRRRGSAVDARTLLRRRGCQAIIVEFGRAKPGVGRPQRQAGEWLDVLVEKRHPSQRLFANGALR